MFLKHILRPSRACCFAQQEQLQDMQHRIAEQVPGTSQHIPPPPTTFRQKKLVYYSEIYAAPCVYCRFVQLILRARVQRRQLRECDEESVSVCVFV